MIVAVRMVPPFLLGHCQGNPALVTLSLSFSASISYVAVRCSPTLSTMAPSFKNVGGFWCSWLFHITSNLVIACELQVYLDFVVRCTELVL